MGETKACKTCGETLSLEMFYFNKSHNNYTSKCKPCWTQYYNQKRRELYKDDYLAVLVQNKRSQSKQKNLKFNLTKGHLRSLWEKQQGICPVLDVPIFLNDPAQSNSKATLDRIVPSLGYTEGNVVFISWLANRVKSDCTDPEVFIKVSQYVASNNKQEQPEFDFSFPN